MTTYILILLALAIALVLIGIGSSLDTHYQRALRREIARERRQLHEYRRMQPTTSQAESLWEYAD